MSVLNLNARLSKVKETRETVVDMKNEFEKITKRLQASEQRLTEVNVELANLKDEIDGPKQGLDNMHSVVCDIQERILELATKEEVKNIADEVTSCMEEYVLNATPRNKGNEMGEKIKEIDDQIAYIMDELNKHRVEDVVVATDRSVPKIVFRKPEKRTKTV